MYGEMMNYHCENPACDLRAEIISEKIARRHELRCESCGTALVCAANTDRSIQTESTAPGDIGQRVLERFPFPVAYGYRKVVEVENALRAEESVFFTYNALLRFGTLVFLGQFLDSKVQNPHAAKAIRGLQNPCIANWHTALITLGKHLFPPPANGQPFPDFGAGGPFSPGLVGPARNLSKLKDDGVSIHDRLRLARNEIWGHGTIREEEQAARRLPGLRALLEKVLELFLPLADIELLRRSPNGMIRLIGAGEPFVEEPVSDPRLEDLFDESDTVLRNSRGDLLPLYPLFLSPDEPQPEGYTEPLLVFDGHGKETAVYMGVRSRSERRDTLVRYLDLLKAKDIDPRFTVAELQPWSVAQWAREETLGTIKNLKGVKYFPAFYQERRTGRRPAGQPVRPVPEGAAHDVEEQEEPVTGADDVVDRWLDAGPESALIVAAEAGAGKTSLFCRVAEKLLGGGESREAVLNGAGESGTPLERSAPLDCVLLLLGGGVRGQTTLFERIRDGLGFVDDVSKGAPERFDQLLDAWSIRGDQLDLEHEHRRLVLLVDAVNEAEDPKPLFEELSRLAATAAACNRKLGRRFVRLLVSVRAERIETLVERWQERHDTPFLEHPQNFAHFDNARGKRVPYLALRRFTIEEAGLAYESAQRTLSASCPAAWERLAPATRELLRHPLLVLLFHRAYAGNVAPASVRAAEAVWGQWLDRTFSPEQGGQELEQNALVLADACLDGGHDRVPAELAVQWRATWQAKQENDPIRIAAGLDPLERLTEAGFLRDAEAGGLDWVSDSLAEQVYFRALRRRDRSLSEESLAQWIGLPRTPRLDGALVHAGVALWASGRPLGLRPFLDATDDRWARMLLGNTLTRVAPRGPAAEVATEAEQFGAALEELTAWTAQEGGHQRCNRLKDALVWEVGKALAVHWGTTPALHQVYLS